jgi:hypothetical protein
MFLSITDASKIVGISKNQIYVMRRQGKLTFNLDGRGIEESELARVFPKEMSHHLSSKSSSSIIKNTHDYKDDILAVTPNGEHSYIKDKQGNILKTENSLFLTQEIAHLKDKLNIMEENKKFLEKQLEMEQDRTQKLIESVQHQTKFLLPKEDKQSISFWRWKK